MVPTLSEDKYNNTNAAATSDGSGERQRLSHPRQQGLRTNAPTSRVGRNWTESGGKTP